MDGSGGSGGGFDSGSSLRVAIWVVVGSGLISKSGNSSANDLVAPLIGRLSGDRYSALTLGNSASAVDFNTSLAKLELVSVFFVRFGSFRLGVWNSLFLTWLWLE